MAAYKTEFQVESPNVQYTDDAIVARYRYESTRVRDENGVTKAVPVSREYQFKTDRKVPRTGMMIVGLGGNNGTTVTAGILANREYV